MSVSNIILCFSTNETDQEARFKMIDAYLQGPADNRSGARPLRPVDNAGDEQIGGNRMLESHVAVGAYADLDIEALLAQIYCLPWTWVNLVQLFVMDDDEELFTERFQPYRRSIRGV